jgi:hypothetical protein
MINENKANLNHKDIENIKNHYRNKKIFFSFIKATAVCSFPGIISFYLFSATEFKNIFAINLMTFFLLTF